MTSLLPIYELLVRILIINPPERLVNTKYEKNYSYYDLAIRTTSCYNTNEVMTMHSNPAEIGERIKAARKAAPLEPNRAGTASGQDDAHSSKNTKAVRVSHP